MLAMASNGTARRKLAHEQLKREDVCIACLVINNLKLVIIFSTENPSEQTTVNLHINTSTIWQRYITSGIP